MKNMTVLAVIILAMFLGSSFGEDGKNEGDRILGVWVGKITDQIIIKMEFHKEPDDLYYSEIIAVPKEIEDGNRQLTGKIKTKIPRRLVNADKRDFVGTRYIHHLSYNPQKKVYEGGKISVGDKDVNCEVKLTSDDELEVTIPFFSGKKTIIWLRDNEQTSENNKEPIK